MKLQDIKFEKWSPSIKSILSRYAHNVYDLIKINGLCRIRGLGELRHSFIVKYLSDMGLHLEMTPLDIFNSKFFLENKHKFELQDEFTPEAKKNNVIR